MSGETYNAKQVVLTFGVLVLDGLGTGDAINVEFNNPGATAKVGVAGEAAFSESNDNSGMVKVKTMATAGVNRALTALYNAGNLPLPLSVTDISTGETLVAAKAKIRKLPNRPYGAEVPEREWEFVCLEMVAI